MADCLWALLKTDGLDDNTAPAYAGAAFLARGLEDLRVTLDHIRKLSSR